MLLLDDHIDRDDDGCDENASSLGRNAVCSESIACSVRIPIDQSFGVHEEIET